MARATVTACIVGDDMQPVRRELRRTQSGGAHRRDAAEQAVQNHERRPRAVLLVVQVDSANVHVGHQCTGGGNARGRAERARNPQKLSSTM
jgi:hypothetical protein